VSQEKVDLVRRGFEAFQQGDLTEMLDLVADDLVTYRADPDGATYPGRRASFRRLLTGLKGSASGR
jgi:ketosteroid isomerase-like protein